MSQGSFFLTTVSIFVLIPCGVICMSMSNVDMGIKVLGVCQVVFGAFWLFLETYAVNGFIRNLF